MVRLFTRGAVALAAVTIFIFTFGASAAVPDTGLQNVNLACNDGTNQNLALDLNSVNALAGAVSGMALFPAGDPFCLTGWLLLSLWLHTRQLSAASVLTHIHPLLCRTHLLPP